MEQIRYYSTNGNAPLVSFREALLQGIAPDKGLFLPNIIPNVSQREIASMKNMEYWQVAFTVAKKFLGGEIPDSELERICRGTYVFPVPLKQVYTRNYLLLLDQGPTASFKDFAACMMSRLVQFFLLKDEKSMTILTATSGDTGSAVANAFFGLKNIRVIVLFPEKEVSETQRKQMTTLGGNITAIAVDGKFDDCQAIVKKAFADSDLKKFNLSSANSINFGRLLPQMVYYFYACAKLSEKEGGKVVFSVPSGNFGDVCAGMLAQRMGLPVEKFVIAVNDNNEFPVFLETGEYFKIVPSRECLSNAMNVGHPSNLARIVDFYGGQMDETGKVNKLPDMEKMRKDIFSISVSDAQTAQAIKEAYSKYTVVLEPHGAVAWFALQEFLKKEKADFCVSIETAHPAKFPETIKKTIGVTPALPVSLSGLEGKKEKFEKMPNDYEKFKAFLLTSL